MIAPHKMCTARFVVMLNSDRFNEKIRVYSVFTFILCEHAIVLIISQSVYGIHFSGFIRGIISEENAYHHGEKD